MEENKYLECGVCHAEVAPDARICPKCGNVFRKIYNAEDVYRPCPKCGKSMHKKLDACPNCGYIVTKAFYKWGIVGVVLLIAAIIWGYQWDRLICTAPLSLLGVWLIYHSIRDLIGRAPKESKTQTKDHQSNTDI